MIPDAHRAPEARTLAADRLAAARIYCDLASTALGDRTADATAEAITYLDAAMALLNGGPVPTDQPHDGAALGDGS